MSDTPTPPFDPTTDTGAVTPTPDPTAVPVALPTVDQPAPTPDPTIPPPPPAPAPAPAPEPAPAPQLLIGQVVTHTFFDPYTGPGGQEITLTGLVVAVETDGAARVSWLDASDPIPANELTVL